jgi:NitT/TauT family transport system ATP-binding protein
MRQRVGFARALALNPDIILMDEPFSSVDEQTRELLQEQLLDVWRETRKTVLFITHSIDEAVYMANRVVVMAARPGRVVEDINVDLPQPRTGDVRTLPRFGEIRAHAWDLLKQSIREAAELGVPS